MAREMNKKIRPFRLENSDAIEENERILEAGSQQRKENREAEQAEQANNASTESATSDAATVPELTTVPTTSTTSTISTASTEPAASPAPTSESATQEPAQTDTPTNSFATNGKKTANGIVVNVPMEDYLQLMLMKCQTGRTLKDLALQAIHEFVERNINS